MSTDPVALDLNLLRYLLALVREASVSRAALRMGVTQPAMSAALKRLRERFDDPILVRTGQTMTPTPRAAEMAGRIEPILDSVREMTLPRQRFDPARARRTFTLMGSDYIQLFLLPHLCAHMEKLAPNVTLVQRPANPTKVEAWLQSGQVDLGIGYLAAPPENLRTRLLFSDDQVCIVRKGHPVLNTPFTAETYAALTHVTVSPGGAGFYGARIDSLLLSMGIRRHVGMTLPSFLAVPYIVASTQFIATVPARIASYFSQLLPLQVVKPPIQFPGFDISLFWHERAHTDQANGWLRQEVLAAARRIGVRRP